MRATSCGTSASFYVSFDPQTCVAAIPIQTFRVGICQPSPSDPTEFLIVQCSTPRIVAQISLYSDTECSTLVGSSFMPVNPVLATNDACTPFIYQTMGRALYVRAASCGDDVVVDYFSGATCQQTSLLGSETRRMNSCDRYAGLTGTMSIKYVCRFEPAPPSQPSLPPSQPSLPPAASGAASGATSPSVIAGSVIGAVVCKPHIRSVTSPVLLVHV